jgi:lysophospholipase L1-like esterase
MSFREKTESFRGQDRSLKAALLFVATMFLLVGCHSLKPQPEKMKQTEVVDAKEKKDVPVGPINYVALGDSTGVGVGAKGGGYVARLFRRIQQARPGSKVTNLCVSGATSGDVRRNQLERAIKADPSLVTLGIGINDISHGASPQEFSENIEAILSRLQSQTKARVIVTNIPDISTAPRIPQMMQSELERLIVLFNQRINEIAGRHAATVVDIHGATQQQLASHPEYFSGDGFHPSDEGYEMWAERMWPALAREIGVSVE